MQRVKIRKHILGLFLVCLSISCYSQLGVGIHYSETSFAGVNYTFQDRIIVELRVTEDAFTEPMIGYFLANSELVNFYSGLAINGRSRHFLLPFGMNLYPLKNKSIGLHIETAILVRDESAVRGSIGIRYRFIKG